jgi:hypothetical protein
MRYKEIKANVLGRHSSTMFMMEYVYSRAKVTHG